MRTDRGKGWGWMRWASQGPWRDLPILLAGLFVLSAAENVAAQEPLPEWTSSENPKPPPPAQRPPPPQPDRPPLPDWFDPERMAHSLHYCMPEVYEHVSSSILERPGRLVSARRSNLLWDERWRCYVEEFYHPHYVLLHPTLGTRHYTRSGSAVHATLEFNQGQFKLPGYHGGLAFRAHPRVESSMTLGTNGRILEAGASVTPFGSFGYTGAPWDSRFRASGPRIEVWDEPTLVRGTSLSTLLVSVDGFFRDHVVTADVGLGVLGSRSMLTDRRGEPATALRAVTATGGVGFRPMYWLISPEPFVVGTVDVARSNTKSAESTFDTWYRAAWGMRFHTDSPFQVSASYEYRGTLSPVARRRTHVRFAQITVSYLFSNLIVRPY